jgi:molybdopterin synthase catalytic subunit
MGKHDLLQITDRPINPEEIIDRIKGDDCGAVVSFTGRVRRYTGEKKVYSLEHYLPAEEAKGLLDEIAGEIRKGWDVQQMAFCYRTGPVAAGEVTVFIAVATRRRPEAFTACQYAIDRFKQIVSAKEIREDGEFWIGGTT